MGIAKPGSFKPGCLQFLCASALLRSFAPFCAFLRSFADLCLRSFALICALLSSFACFCERPRLERPHWGTPEKAPKISGNFRSIFRKKSGAWKQSFPANFVLQTCGEKCGENLGNFVSTFVLSLGYWFLCTCNAGRRSPFWQFSASGV